LVTDGKRLLMGHSTNNTFWDLPKGELDSGESPLEAAVRELKEETGLDAPIEELRDLGKFMYRPGKDLWLFSWRPKVMPDPETLECLSTFEMYGKTFPELDRFVVTAEFFPLMNKSMRRVFNEIELEDV